MVDNQDKPMTLFEKVWRSHLVQRETPEVPAVLYIDLHLLHEVTSPQAFADLRQLDLTVRRPRQSLATMDHVTPTTLGSDGCPLSITDPVILTQLETLRCNCHDFGIPLLDLGDPRRGIAHVIAPELGLTQPGMTIACGDSHTSTHGAFGALAFGIGTSEVGHILASQCLLRRKPKTMRIWLDGCIKPGVDAKDIPLAIARQIGVGGGVGYVTEYAGSALSDLDMESRMTICNMTIEFGSYAGMIAPDATTFEYLANRPFSPRGKVWEAALGSWRKLYTAIDAVFDREVCLDIGELAPMITYGTNPGMSIAIDACIPYPASISDLNEREEIGKALRYMDIHPGEPLLGHKVDVVFLGSCTNSRISDLRKAARILRGHKIAAGVRMFVVPGSTQVKAQAEAEELDVVFQTAGAEWRDPGCSMCVAMNGDELLPGQYAISTSNRNFEGRQGKGGRTFLASPLTAAASAIRGVISDPRRMEY